MAKKKTVWGVKETRRGGKRGRIVRSRGTKEFAKKHAAACRRVSGDKFTYRVVKVEPASPKSMWG